MPSLLDALSYVGSSLDKPGAAVRGLLAGRPGQMMTMVPFSDTLGLTDESSRVSGRDLLEYWGLLGPNQEGLDLGDVAGFGAEIVTDPLNLVGGALAGRAAKLGKAAGRSNALREAVLKAGGMPEEVARLTKVVDEAGNPLRTYHGTGAVFDKYDLGKMGNEGFARAIYSTPDPELASSYAMSYADEGLPASVRTQFLDVRNPLDLGAGPVPLESLAEPLRGAARPFVSGPAADLPALQARLNGAGRDFVQLARDSGYDALREMDDVGFDPYRESPVWAVFDPSQVYAPRVAPAERRAPRLSPILAALGGHNAGAATGRY